MRWFWLFCCSPAVSSFVQGYLPALLLAVILYICPSIFFFLSRFEGHPSVSHQERKASSKMFSLLAGNIFLAAVLSGSLITISESFSEDPKSIPSRLAEAVPKQVCIYSLQTLKAFQSFRVHLNTVLDNKLGPVHVYRFI